MIRLTSSNDISVSLTMSSEVDIPQHVNIVVIYIYEFKTYTILLIAYFSFDNCLKNTDITTLKVLLYKSSHHMLFKLFNKVRLHMKLRCLYIIDHLWI